MSYLLDILIHVRKLNGVALIMSSQATVNQRLLELLCRTVGLLR